MKSHEVYILLLNGKIPACTWDWKWEEEHFVNYNHRVEVPINKIHEQTFWSYHEAVEAGQEWLNQGIDTGETWEDVMYFTIEKRFIPNWD